MAICGIAAGKRGRPVEERDLTAMLSAVSLQSDWSRVSCVESCAGLAGVSLAPSTSAWKSNQLLAVCDADLFNRDELRASWPAAELAPNLAALLAALYRKEGLGFLARLRGAFSLALWDKERNALVLAVDRFSVKPLYYALHASELVFASQPRGLFASGRVEKRVDLAAIVEYLNFSAVPAPHTAYAGVAKLPAATYLLWEDGKARTGRYWEMAYPEDAQAPTERLAEELLERMQESVRLTSADVPPAQFGCFLSGGTDSSSIAGLLTGITGSPVSTFSIGFSDQRFNELNYAQLAARHFHTQHTEKILGPEDAYRSIPKIVAGYDEPFGNASVIPTYCCQTLARERGIRVLLAGDGGDELFGGNERYRTDQIYQFYQRIPGVWRRWLVEPLVFALPSSVGGKLQRYIRRANIGNPERYCEWQLLQYFPAKQILGPGMPLRNGNADLLAIPRALYQSARARSELNRLLYVDYQMTLADNDLPKVVRTSEMAGVSVRFPYLDHPLAEFSGRLPVHLKLRGLNKRYLFKRATRRLLPKEILQKKKHGFGLPIGLWLKSDAKLRAMAEGVLLDPRTYQRGYFQRTFVEELFRRMDADATPYFGDLLWLFLMLELWHRHHIEGEAA